MSLFKILLVIALGFLLWRVVTSNKLMVKSGRFAKKLKDKTASPPAAPTPAPKPAHEVLGVAKGASVDEAKRAYLDLVKQVHPDRGDALSPEMKRLAEARTKELNDAFDRFKDR